MPSQTRQLAAKEATATTPIVFGEVSQPVQQSLVASLSRPGGNLTGVADVSIELTPRSASSSSRPAPELRLLRRWLASWAGLGLIVVGIRRLGYESEFRQYPQGWRVNVRRASVDPLIASGWAPTPWEGCRARRGRR